jgi:hypothetical protein
MSSRMLRWGLAAMLLIAALVDAYLAVSESVAWPAILAVAWIGLAAALITQETKPVEIPGPREPQSLRERHTAHV